MWGRYGSDIEDLNRMAMCSLTGKLKLHGGLLFKDAGTLNPMSYARGLASAATMVGAEIYVKLIAEKLIRDAHRPPHVAA